MSATRQGCPLSLLADIALHENEATASVERHDCEHSVVAPCEGNDSRRYSAPFGDVALFGNGVSALPERCTLATSTASAPFVMHSSSTAQCSPSGPCGIDRVQPKREAVVLAGFCPPSAVQPTVREHAGQAPAVSTLAAPGGGYVPQQANPTRSLFCSGNGAQAGSSVYTAPLIELGDSSPSLDHATNAPTASTEAGATQTLLQNAVQVIQALSGAVQALSAVPKRAQPAVMLAWRDYLDSLTRYQRAMGLDDQDVLGRVVPAALTDTAARWYRHSGYRAATLEEFRAAFLREFLPADYGSRMRRELEMRTQAPDESLQEYVRAMDNLLVIRQAHPTFSVYLRGARFRDLEELAAEAKRIQGDILAARAYRPPPPASEALEPLCAWGGAMPSPQHSTGAAFAAASGCSWELSARALDPYTHGRWAACAAPPPDTHAKGRLPTQCSAVSDARRSVSFDNAASRTRQLETAPSRERDRNGVRCFRCHERGHMARECTGSRPPVRQGNGAAGRGKAPATSPPLWLPSPECPAVLPGLPTDPDATMAPRNSGSEEARRTGAAKTWARHPDVTAGVGAAFRSHVDAPAGDRGAPLLLQRCALEGAAAGTAGPPSGSGAVAVDAAAQGAQLPASPEAVLCAECRGTVFHNSHYEGRRHAPRAGPAADGGGRAGEVTTLGDAELAAFCLRRLRDNPRFATLLTPSAEPSPTVTEAFARDTADAVRADQVLDWTINL
ncbi:hypothetical protein HPB50_028764 [Hyalomma asiaticum]|nr:hypothetical protein HPB50_028764 [Hyalomma asiaticum]